MDWGRRASVTAVDEATDCENPRGGKRKGRKTAKVAILLLPSFNALDLAVVLQSLEEADRIAAMTAPGKHLGRPVFLSIAGGEIGGANSAFRISTQRLDGKTSYRYLIAVGADDAPSAEVAQLGNQLALARAGRILATSSGVYWLAAARLLEDVPAAVHWAQIGDFKNRYPRIRQSRYTIDGDKGIFTSVGGLGTLDLMLHAVTEHYGEEIAKMVSDRLVLGNRPGGNMTQWRISLRHLCLRIPGFSSLLRHIDKRGYQVSKKELSAVSGLGMRQLERLCRRHLGVTPLGLIRQRQMHRAHALICYSTMPIAEIATKVGFASSSHFSERYKLEFGSSPTTLVSYNSNRSRSVSGTDERRNRSAARRVPEGVKSEA